MFFMRGLPDRVETLIIYEEHVFYALHIEPKSKFVQKLSMYSRTLKYFLLKSMHILNKNQTCLPTVYQEKKKIAIVRSLSKYQN